MDQTLFSKAYTFFLRANEIENAIVAIREVMLTGYKNEQDLFVARLCLEVLIRNYKDQQRALSTVNTVLAAFPEQASSPFVTFVQMICEVINLGGDGDDFKQVVNLYKPQLSRDRSCIEYIDRIAKYFFNSTVKAPNPMQQMLNNMMGGGKPPGMP